MQAKKGKLQRSKLHGSTFQNVDLRDAEFWGADLTGVHFTPLQLPDENSLAHAKNLQTMRGADPTALRALASHFREVGNSDREREVTYAMEASLQQKGGRDLPHWEILSEYLRLGRPDAAVLPVPGQGGSVWVHLQLWTVALETAAASLWIVGKFSPSY